MASLKLPIVLAASLSMLTACATGALANSSNGNKNGFTTTSTQGNSSQTCNNSSGCTTTLQNNGGNNKTCTSPDALCSK
jgi:hypothetical protein